MKRFNISRGVSKSIPETPQINVAKLTTYLERLYVSNRVHYDTIVAAMNRTTAIEKVALYARVSTKDGRQDTENQVIQLREYCAKQNWTIVQEYIDHDSGGHSRRKHFQQMFADARSRKFDLVLFWSLDRLSREGVAETLQHLQRLTDAGVDWRSYTEQYLDSTGIFRDAIIGILAVIAKQERVRRSERAAAAVQRLRKTGQADRLGRKRLVVGHKLERVRELHEQGLSLREIGRQLKVSPMTVMRVLAA
jgi:DNA invertase Pin-like site-specific DNA recombinase